MIIVTYDISNDKKRTKFSKFLEQYGDRIQFSVFAFKNSSRVLNNIVTEIEHRYGRYFGKEDSVFVMQTCKTCDSKIKKYGNAKHYEKDVVYF